MSEMVTGWPSPYPGSARLLHLVGRVAQTWAEPCHPLCLMGQWCPPPQSQHHKHCISVGWSGQLCGHTGLPRCWVLVLLCLSGPSCKTAHHRACLQSWRGHPGCTAHRAACSLPGVLNVRAWGASSTQCTFSGSVPGLLVRQPAVCSWEV